MADENCLNRTPIEGEVEVRLFSYILRRLAEQKLGEFAWEPKKAAQYGSGFSKILPKPKGKFLSSIVPNNRKLVALVSGGKDSWYSILIAT